MNSCNRISTLISICAVALSWVVFSQPAQAATVGFDQVSWANGTGGFQDQSSQWGEATVSFSAGDVGSLTAFGSGYMGWVNILTDVSGGSNNNWAVQNEPVIFDSPADLTGNVPLTFKFDLGQADGTAVSSLNYSFSLSASPLSLAPGGGLSAASVAAATELEGNQTDPNSEGDEAAGSIGDAIGAAAAGGLAGLAAGLTGRGTIQTPTTNIAVVTEAENGCAPGAAARSIRYLGNMFPSLNVTQSAQQIYGTLTNLMQSDTGPGSSNGTKIANFISGKNSYFTTNGLSIAPTVVTTNFGQVISALNSTGDVELGVFWGFTITTNIITGRISTNSLGGHAVFVSGVTTLYTNGIPYRYIVDVLQDPNQGGGSTNNEADRYTFDTNGNMLNRGGLFAGINSFRIETSMIPEPSTIELAALGMGALGLARAFQRRRRRRT